MLSGRSSDDTKLIADPENNGKKCGTPTQTDDRTFYLRDRQATTENCKLTCLNDPACIAFSGIWNSWCIGCKTELSAEHAGAVAFVKSGKSVSPV